MIDDDHVKTLNETGEWLLNRARDLVVERKKKKRVSKKLTNRWRELNGRMKLFLNDMKKVTDEGEEWKNEN